MACTSEFRIRWGVLGHSVAVALVSLTLLTGCAEPVSIAAVEPTTTAYPPPPTDIPPPPPGQTPAAFDFPLAAPNHLEEAEPDSDRGCVVCHTDEGTLRELAEEGEGANESLSEGEG